MYVHLASEAAIISLSPSLSVCCVVFHSLCRVVSTAWEQWSITSLTTILSLKTASKSSTVSAHPIIYPFSNPHISPSHVSFPPVLLERVNTLHSQNSGNPLLKALRPSLLRSTFTVGLLCKHFDMDSFLPSSTKVGAPPPHTTQCVSTLPQM